MAKRPRDVLESRTFTKVDLKTLVRYESMDRTAQLALVTKHGGRTTADSAHPDLLCIGAITPYPDVQEQIAVAAMPMVDTKTSSTMVFCEPLLPCLRVNPRLVEKLKKTMDDIVGRIYADVIFSDPIVTDREFEYRFMWVDGKRRIFKQTLGAAFVGSSKGGNVHLQVYSEIIRWLRT